MWPRRVAVSPARPARITGLGGLLGAGLVSVEQGPEIAAVIDRFRVGITPAMRAQIRGAHDPLGRQFVPDPREIQVHPSEQADPIGDAAHSPVEGLVHRYPDRVLLLPTLLCQVYCRFCFRRETVGDPTRGVLTEARTGAALDWLAAHPEVREVILTGGDPLVLSPARIGRLVVALAGIPHLRVLRVHTRVPLVAPERVTAELVSALKSRLATWVVAHVNHPDELTPDGLAACARLIDAGLPMLSQSVLLAGVNDDVDVLARLFQGLVESRIKPYYLHHLDLAEGTGHFRVSLSRGQALVRALRGRISGLAQPTYVLDIPGGHGKVPIGGTWIHAAGDGRYSVEDPWGGLHDYEDWG